MRQTGVTIHFPGVWREATPDEIVDGAERHDDFLYGEMSNSEER